MAKALRALVPAALAGSLLLIGSTSANATPTSHPTTTQDGQHSATGRHYCGYHHGVGPLRLGDQGSAVRQLQCLLKEQGYYTGPIHGYFDEATEKALKAFQRDHGLKADGIVGPNTWKKLRS
ncbi:peptidoglycan-binding domain-containing protein [Streptomyces sp. HSW2009]|uniref:peptidoglycan-binding domain-containing protein n=1 Tax=Streptomyces sp. HSW2009 TaxID=3142890 RepID=UPI0032EBA2B5